MEQIWIRLDRESFSCLICLDLLTDPVTLPCGHTHCMSCIRGWWEGREAHSCPQCRQDFRPRPVLLKDTMLALVVEELRKMAQGYARRRDVSCDVCPERKLKAQRSCLVCLASYCEAHLQPHFRSAAFRGHKLVAARRKLRDRRCPRHGEAVPGTLGSDLACACGPQGEERCREAPARAEIATEIVLRQEPGTRAEFLRYSHDITLDPNTANRHVRLSDRNRRVTFTAEEQSYRCHPDRFMNDWQVLSQDGLTGRCYWEVDWTGKGVHVAVAYRNISRADDESIFGWNDKSWALDCNTKEYKFLYKDVSIDVPGPPSSRVGVYLDHGAGLLAFYSVSATMTLLHQFRGSFTQPLHAGLTLYDYGDTARFIRHPEDEGPRGDE